MQQYLAELLKWYRDEIGGEAMFAVLARAATERDCASKWLTLARLEEHVAERLRTVLVAHGVELPSLEEDRQRGVESAQPYVGVAWREALEQLRPELAGYVHAFQAAEASMPVDVLPLARFVTAHEQALLDFVTCELERSGRNSLDSVNRLLGEGTPAPVAVAGNAERY